MRQSGTINSMTPPSASSSFSCHLSEVPHICPCQIKTYSLPYQSCLMTTI